MKIYIINVSTNEERRNHILGQLSQHDCLTNYAFIHQGDMDSITPTILQSYFAGGDLSPISSATSCAYKHFLAYESIIANNDPMALILEDNIFLEKRICEGMLLICSEIDKRQLKRFLISLEDSSLEYVKASERKKGIMLYPKPKGRMTGAYLIDQYAAQNILTEIAKNKCHVPIDWFHSHCASKGLFDIYWSHPTWSSQGSLNGRISSTISDKKKSYIQRLSFQLKKLYKQKILYQLR